MSSCCHASVGLIKLHISSLHPADPSWFTAPPPLPPFCPWTCRALQDCWGFSLPPWPANMPAALTDSSQIICEVWASNVEEEMRKIRQIIQSYNYVAMVGKWVSLSRSCLRNRAENMFSLSLCFNSHSSHLQRISFKFFPSSGCSFLWFHTFTFPIRTQNSPVSLSGQSASSAAQWTTSTSCWGVTSTFWRSSS